MGIAERIADEVRTLPENEAREVLDFVGYLKAKHRVAEEDLAWNVVSLGAALAGLEEDVFPEYRENDLVERWQ